MLSQCWTESLSDHVNALGRDQPSQLVFHDCASRDDAGLLDAIHQSDYDIPGVVSDWQELPEAGVGMEEHAAGSTPYWAY